MVAYVLKHIHQFMMHCIDPAMLAVYIRFTGWTSFQHFLLIWFQRLASGEWFTARVSSCGLFHIAYPSAPEMSKIELRSMYSLLCQDDMPMVRRSAASNLGKYAATVEYAHLKADTMSIFEDLTKDGNWIHISHSFLMSWPVNHKFNNKFSLIQLA